jgi:hypothetical protein
MRPELRFWCWLVARAIQIIAVFATLNFTGQLCKRIPDEELSQKFMFLTYIATALAIVSRGANSVTSWAIRNRWIQIYTRLFLLNRKFDLAIFLVNVYITTKSYAVAKKLTKQAQLARTNWTPRAGAESV